MRRVEPLIDHRKRGKAARIQMKPTIIISILKQTTDWWNIKIMSNLIAVTTHQEIN